MELSFTTLAIIAVLVFGLFWIRDHKPETYENGKSTISGFFSKIWSTITGKVTEDEKEVEGVYGKPMQPYNCTSDEQCFEYFDVTGILCNYTSGDCYIS